LISFLRTRFGSFINGFVINMIKKATLGGF
jgi:hypothetical protein